MSAAAPWWLPGVAPEAVLITSDADIWPFRASLYALDTAQAGGCGVDPGNSGCKPQQYAGQTCSQKELFEITICV